MEKDKLTSEIEKALEKAIDSEKEDSKTCKSESENLEKEILELEISEETVPEETVPEENVPEETVPEDVVLEEVSEKNPNCKWDFNKKIAIFAGVAAVVLIAVYLGVAMYFSERFLPRTSVNGMACDGNTVEEIEAWLQAQVEDYVLVLEERNDVEEQIKGTDIGIQYNNTGVVKEAMEKQNKYAWPISFFDKTEITADIDFVYDEMKLNEKITALNCLKEENQEAPVSAIPVYKDGEYVIQEESYGSQIKTEEFTKAVIDSVNTMDSVLNLEEAECYVNPVYVKDSKEVIAATETLNKCLSTEITYSLDSIVVKLDKTQILHWLSVDENMTVTLSESGVSAFAGTLGDTYNTAPRTQQITTPTGKVANVSGATKGRIIGTAAEAERLMSDIMEGKVVTREPIISQYATPAGQYAWGTTYIEVDISAQHMWYIQNGTVVFESDVITGSPGRDTPAGVFEILTKKRNKTLVGNIVPETGEPEYRTPVDYWARVTWSGIGFHDATWQPAFGGQLYKQGYGSHGCINMPYGKVKELYEMISVGDPVVIHY